MDSIETRNAAHRPENEMARIADDNEQYEDTVTTKARARHAAMTACVAAGAPKTLQLIVDALGQYLADDQALAELVQKTARGENALQAVLRDVIWSEAEKLAEAEAAQEAAGRRASAAEARAERGLWNHRFA